MAKIINVQGIDISYKKVNDNDFISLTDIAKFRTGEPDKVIANWMRTYNTLSFLGTWETIHNPTFNPLEFEGFKNQSGENSFLMSPSKWIKSTNAIGIVSRPGKYGGGTFAHKDIAFKFASWLSVEFELYIILEFQRLKEHEHHQLQWTAKRELAKINYHLQTKAIAENLIMPTLTEKQKLYTYTDEADLLNVVLFGKTAKEWREQNPDKNHAQENMRDYATINQLLVLSFMESHNARMIAKKIPQRERMTELHEIAQDQLRGLAKVDNKVLLPKEC